MFQIIPLNLEKHEVDDSVVRIDYGPYEAHGVMTHRIQRLRGLISHLTDLGYKIEIRKVNLINRLEIIMYRRKIFQCDIRNLQFNMISEYDCVCLRVVSAVEEAANRMRLEIKESNEVVEENTEETEKEIDFLKSNTDFVFETEK